MTRRHNKSNGDEREPTAAEVLRQAWEAGRPIVPFLAAGISAGSGFPLISELNRYLLKTKFYIKYGAYRESFGRPMDRPSKLTDPENRTSQFLSDYGWPNFNQLDLELDHFSRQSATKLHSIELQGVTQRDERILWLDNIVGNTFKSYGEDLGRRESDEEKWTTWQKYLKLTADDPKWGRSRWRLASACQHVLLEDIRSKDRDLAGELQAKAWGLGLVPRSDWSQLLIDLAEGRLGLVDALLGGLGFRYRPGSSHVILAHLVDLLGIRLLLTTNFDPYIEKALEQEGAVPRVLDIVRDAKPPDTEVVKQSLSVIKLHGSSYNLGFGERLDYELDEATRSAVQRYVPDDALLLVLGFSGGERRMMQLIEHLVFGVASRSAKNRDDTKIIWMHHEPESGLSFPIRNFRARLKSLGQERLFHLERLSDAGEFLLDAYQHIARTLPKSRSRFSALPKRILPRTDRRDDAHRSASLELSPYGQIAGHPYHLFIRASLKEPASEPMWMVFEDGPDSRGSPSLEMSEFVAFRQAEQYRPVWIDLEEHHTISGVITEIVDKLRVYDPDLPPSVGGLDPAYKFDVPKRSSVGGLDSAYNFDVPMRLIRRALKRGRYVLAFDSLDSFGRKQTVHHGVAVMKENDGSLDRVRGLLDFMKRLTTVGDSISKRNEGVDQELRTLDWYCCVACDEPMPRHLPELQTSEKVNAELDTWRTIRTGIRDFIDRWPAPLDPFAADAASKPHSAMRGSVAREAPVASSPLQDAWTDSQAQSEDWHQTYHRFRRNRVEPTDKAKLPVANLKDVLLRIHEHCGKPVRAQLPVETRSESQGVVNEIVRLSLGDFRDILLRPDADLSHVGWLKRLDAAYCMLAVFRRPLNFVSIQAVWSEFMPARSVAGLDARCDAITEALDKLHDMKLLYRTKGGLYWLPRHVHAWTYKVLSEPLRLSRIDGLNQDRYRQDFESGALVDRFRRLVFLMLIHSRVARHYYLTLFQCSHDQNALFECFYHLISALRYAKVFDFYWSYGGLLASNDASSKLKDMMSGVAGSIRPDLELLDRHEGLTRQTHESWTEDQRRLPIETDVDSISRTIAALQMKLLQELLNTLSREDETIRSTGSADTWLAWIQELRIDLPRIVVSKKDPERTTSQDVRDAWTKSSDEPLLAQRRQIEWHLSALEARLFREKRDARECIGKRIEMLEATCLEALGEVERRSSDDPIASGASATEKSVRDELRSFSVDAQNAFKVVKPVVKLAFMSNDPATYLHIWTEFWKRTESELVPKLKLLFDRVRNADELSIIDVVFGGLRDITECLIHLTQGTRRRELIEAIQANTGVLLDRFADAGGELLFVRFPSLRRKLEVLRHDLELDKLRFQADRLGAWSAHRVDAIGRISDNKAAREGDKLLKEAVFARHRLRGSPFVSGTELATRLCASFIVEAQSLLSLEHFDDAVHVLDLAGNGLDEAVSEHRFLAALVQRRRADVAMRRTDFELRRRADPPIPASRARLREADRAILEAERLLSNGRRDVEEWRCLYEAKAQLQIEHLLLQLAEIDFSYESRQEVLPFVARVHGHLQVGLDAISGGLDCASDPVRIAKESSRNHFAPLISWFMQWLQLMTTGHLALIRFAQQRRLSNSERTSGPMSYVDQAIEQSVEWKWETEELVEMESFSKRWTGLNRAAGLGRFVDGRNEVRLPGPLESLEETDDAEFVDDVAPRAVWTRVLRNFSVLAQTPLDRVAEKLSLQLHSDPPLQSRQLALRFAELWFTLGLKPASKPDERHAVVKLFRTVYPARHGV
jgi:hypothetical protein